MHKRILLVALALVIWGSGASAKDATKRESCPSLDGREIEDLLRNAPSCQRAVTLFEACQFGAGGDVSLGAAVIEKCEGDFVGKLTPNQRRVYTSEQKACARKYQNQAGTMYRSFEAFCGAYVARKYSVKSQRAPAEPR